MAPISDFHLTLVDGVLNLSTTDTRFHDSENQIYLELKNVPYTTGTGQYLGFSSDGTQYTILQDDFPGDLVAKCGLPITNNSKNRCIATIVAELIVEDDQLILKGKEIKQITKNK